MAIGFGAQSCTQYSEEKAVLKLVPKLTEFAVIFYEGFVHPSFDSCQCPCMGMVNFRRLLFKCLRLVLLTFKSPFTVSFLEYSRESNMQRRDGYKKRIFIMIYDKYSLLITIPTLHI